MTPNLKNVSISLLRKLAEAGSGLLMNRPNSLSFKILFKANCTMKRDQRRSTRSSGFFWGLLNKETREELAETNHW